MEKVHQQPVSWTELIATDAFLDETRKKLYTAKVQKSDSFVPEAIKTMLPDDVLAIEKAIDAIDAQVARGIPSYAYFVKFLRKIQVLLVENDSDFFASLPPELQGKIRNAKIEFPTEDDVRTEIFQAMDGPSSVLKGSFSFGMMVKDVLNYDDVSRKLADIFDQYKAEFTNREKAA